MMYTITTAAHETLEELTRYLYHHKIPYYITINQRGGGRRYTTYGITLTVKQDILMDIKKRWRNVRIPVEVPHE